MLWRVQPGAGAKPQPDPRANHSNNLKLQIIFITYSLQGTMCGAW
jgi:hypothetical protein